MKTPVIDAFLNEGRIPRGIEAIAMQREVRELFQECEALEKRCKLKASRVGALARWIECLIREVQDHAEDGDAAVGRRVQWFIKNHDYAKGLDDG